MDTKGKSSASVPVPSSASVTSRPDGFIEEFKKLFDTFKVKSLALNDSVDDTRCDGLTLGLYKNFRKYIVRAISDV